MFNINEEIQNFKPIDLTSLKQKLGQIPEDMQSAIEMYNKALDDVTSHNEDMAIIALKKAIAIYPAFYEAMNLMGVCFEILGDVDGARKMFSRVIQMEDSSIRATDYLNRLDGKDEPKAKSQRNKGDKSQAISWVSSGLAPEKSSPYYLKYILGFAAGIIVMAVLWLLMPADKPLLHFDQITDGSSEITKLQKENNDLTQRLADAMSGLETAQQTETGLRDQIDQYKQWSGTLRDLEKLAAEGKYSDLISEVDKLDGLAIPDDIKTQITALYDSSKAGAVNQIYEAARKTYDGNAVNKSKDVYKEAATQFTLAVSLMEQVQPKPENMLQIYYYAGKAAALSGYPSKDEANTQAKNYFNSIITADPKSQYAYYAQLRIGEIDSGKQIKP